MEGDAEGVRRGIGRAHHALDLVEVYAVLRRGRGDLVHRESASNAAPLVLLLPAGRGDIVGHVHDPSVDSFVDEALRRNSEVQSVTGVVAEPEHHPSTTVCRLGHPVDLLRRRRGEHIAEHGSVGETCSHYTVVGRVVAGAATNHQADLALQRTACPDEAGGTCDALHVLRVGRGEALDHVTLELGGVVVDVRHGEPPGIVSVRRL